MKTIHYINPIFEKKENQEALLHDSLVLFSRNISAQSLRYNGRLLTESEINDIIDLFKEKLIEENL